MKRRQIWPQALLELRAAAEWYEEQRQGLGGERVDEFERTVDEALENLERSAPVATTRGGLPIRRFRLARFARYAIYVAVFEGVPHVVAFEHGSREPGY
jgi:hypothetical protein